MTFPYMGGYVSLISLAFVFIIVYFILMLNHEPDIPKHLRRFILTLSALLLLVQCVIVIIFSIRANDFRVSKDQLSSTQFIKQPLNTPLFSAQRCSTSFSQSFRCQFTSISCSPT
jgi:uncharacterized protein YhhL (DUF1145 family)